MGHSILRYWHGRAKGTSSGPGGWAYRAICSCGWSTWKNSSVEKAIEEFNEVHRKVILFLAQGPDHDFRVQVRGAVVTTAARRSGRAHVRV